ncbi:MAG TPA: hypothetical protein VHH52_03095 [Pseudonocardiaceae bacterium]|nr:hypothetical protein [Pseudonocardiaceae bacterium]
MSYDSAGSLFAIGMRLTLLSDTGAPLAGLQSAYVTDAIVTASIGLEYTEGETVEQRNGAGRMCLSYRAPDTLARGTISDLQVCSPDPNILTFLMGGTVITRPGVDEVQTVTVTGSPTGGTFTITYDGQTTAGIAYNANAAAVQTAIDNLSNVDPGDVVVTGTGPYTLTWDSALGNVSQVTASGAGLTGGSSPGVTVGTTTGGSALTDIGYRAPEIGVDPLPNGVSVEFWTRAVLDGSFASELPYYHWVLPRARLRLSDNFSLSASDPTMPTFEGFMEQNANWGDGGQGDWEFASDRVWQYVRTDTVPDFSPAYLAVA